MDAINFRNFLIRNEALYKFCEAVYKLKGLTFNQAISKQLPSYSGIIMFSFPWADTPEGRDYWANLDTKWKNLSRKGKTIPDIQYKSIW